MKLLVLGVNHETAPVDVRETVAFSPDQVQEALTELRDLGLANEAVLVSTCNRTELYAILKNAIPADLRRWLHQRFQLQENSIDPFLYEYEELAAIRHMMCVASGLNSLVLGEPQILGQIKDAYHAARKADSVHQILNALFQHIFKTAKQVRTDTAIGSSPVSVAFSAVALSKQFFGQLSEQTALLLGAGETSELVARHLHESGIGHLIIANRTLEKAHNLAEDLGGYAINLQEIDDHLHEADMVIASTGAPSHLLSKAQVAAALKKRRNKPIFMVDIAVPRDIDPAVAQFNDTYLYTVDDLQAIIAENKRSRQDAAQAAEEIIDLQAKAFLNQYQATRQISPIIQSFRQQAHELKVQALEQARAQLENGTDPEQVVTKLANQLTNKILHGPTTQLHQAGLEGEQALVQAAERLLTPAETDKAAQTPEPTTTEHTPSRSSPDAKTQASQANASQQRTSVSSSRPSPGPFFQAKPSDAL
jgi:glutamyl-tRNA reductase